MAKRRMVGKGKAPKPGNRRPDVPKDANPLTNENKLFRVPIRRDWAHPWVLYDAIDPAPKFRRMSEDFDFYGGPDDVSEGENSDDISDGTAGDLMLLLPIHVPGYE